jgi:hypothetical protein
MESKFVSRQNVLVILGAVMIVSLALATVTFPAALIWIGQPLGNAAITMADAFASVFSVAFFAAFALAMADQRRRSPGPPKEPETASGSSKPQRPPSKSGAGAGPE